jgi:hypothetical protein
VSSFANPHHIYLFPLRNGKKKLTWGTSPDDAFGTLQLRLSDKEMADVLREGWIKLNHQREMHAYLDQLG